jgi:hypothetical protein
MDTIGCSQGQLGVVLVIVGIEGHKLIVVCSGGLAREVMGNSEQLWAIVGRIRQSGAEVTVKG